MELTDRPSMIRSIIEGETPMLKKPIPATKIITGTSQDEAGLSFGGKRVQQVNLRFKKNQDDCPANALIYHLVKEDTWMAVEVIKAAES